MFGAADLAAALAAPPPAFGGVGDDRWARLRDLERRRPLPGRVRGGLGQRHGASSRARDGLRGRPPEVVEWKGPQRPPGAEPDPRRPAGRPRLPGELQVQLAHPAQRVAPVDLRRRRPGATTARGDWYGEAAPDELQALYEIVRFETGLVGGPARPVRRPGHRPAARAGRRAGQGRLDVAGRGRGLHRAVGRGGRGLGPAVARAAAQRAGARGHAVAVPAGGGGHLLRARVRRRPHGLRLRVGSPWDWRQSFRLRRFDVEPVESRQPVVAWRADGRRPRGRRAAHGRRPHRGAVEPRPLRRPARGQGLPRHAPPPGPGLLAAGVEAATGRPVAPGLSGSGTVRPCPTADADGPTLAVHDEPARRRPEPSPAVRIGRAALALTGVVVAYYAVPVGECPSSWDIVLQRASGCSPGWASWCGSRCARCGGWRTPSGRPERAARRAGARRVRASCRCSPSATTRSSRATPTSSPSWRPRPTPCTSRCRRWRRSASATSTPPASSPGCW